MLIISVKEDQVIQIGEVYISVRNTDSRQIKMLIRADESIRVQRTNFYQTRDGLIEKVKKNNYEKR